MEKINNEKQMLNTREAAALLEMPILTIFQLVRLGKIPHIKPCGRYRRFYFNREQLLEWRRKKSE